MTNNSHDSLKRHMIVSICNINDTYFHFNCLLLFRQACHSNLLPEYTAEYDKGKGRPKNYSGSSKIALKRSHQQSIKDMLQNPSDLRIVTQHQLDLRILVILTLNNFYKSIPLQLCNC